MGSFLLLLCVLARNPFQKNGTDAVGKVIETKEECVIKVDMPGCPDSGLDSWADGNKVHFFASEPKYEESGREYGGSMVYESECYDVKNFKAEIRHGVLWITVPKIPGGNKSVD